MDKYQEFLMEIDNSKYNLFTNKIISNESVLKDNNIVLTQNDDITITDYILYITNESIDAIYAIKENSQVEFEKACEQVNSSIEIESKENFFLSVNFEEKLDKIKIVFKNNLADDLYLPIIYILADKEKYYAKKKQEYRENLLKNADVKVSTGLDLVNIYFQPCCDKYEYTEILLFIPKEEKVTGYRNGRSVIEIRDWYLIKKFKVDIEDFYKSVGGLANRTFSFVLKQFDENGILLLETDHIQFTISSEMKGR